MKSHKLLVICGPTAVGKSSLAVDLAQKFGGEVVSTDSRQVYRGLNIATGKIAVDEMQNVPHHLLNVADPKENFSAADFKVLADKAVADIQRRGKLPILCGGTGFYIQAVVDDLLLPEVEPNEQLREELSGRTTEELFSELKDKDPRRAKEIDPDNPHRLIRALEIVSELGEVPRLQKRERFNTFQIGLDYTDKELKHRIIRRTKQRFEDGMIEEAQNLYENGLSLERMHELGLEYSELANYIEGKINKEELFTNIVQSDWQYARRQRTWFRKDERINWFNPEKDRKDIEKQVDKFLKEK
ncbi:MAG: tRNA (adenosine(37)-N6)-dimethylallyltransferase MiaA [Candidatus Paceibacterota bacterium]